MLEVSTVALIKAEEFVASTVGLVDTRVLDCKLLRLDATVVIIPVR